MQYEQARGYLTQTAGRGIQLGLHRMRAFMKDLGDPQEKTAFIHVAGTNGKGSVSAMIASVLAESGRKVGRYCSPWVFVYEEMIQCQDKDGIRFISKEELVLCVEKIEAVCRKWQQQGKELPTAFELETAMAFMMFDRWNCDVVVLEVGLGGEEDATNIIGTPLVSVITPIAMDHMGILGNTLTEIAEKKAGIIKGSVTVSGFQDPQVEEVLKKRCDACGGTWIETKPDIKVLESSVHGTKFAYRDHVAVIHMLGKHQVENASLAWEACLALPEYLRPSEQKIKKGLEQAKWPGRFEIWEKDPVVVVDGAHNPQGARALKNAIETYFPDCTVHGIMGVFKDKDYEQIIRILQGIFADVTVTRARVARSAEPELVAEVWKKNGMEKVTQEDLPAEALRKVKERSDRKDVIVIFGSLSFLQSLRE
ncbi:MAG: folylpolyglutamate synthase/dihydrofolate synthase family protein [Eubacterium sp.]|nr:folylpolyglutamate synthase/dihydrofolate synthase family protein [Eubacterium sp.]